MPNIDRQLSNSPTLHDRSIVLAAEDNAEMRRFITAARSDEYRGVPCSDGAEALKQATADPPDVVVTDLMMSKLDPQRSISTDTTPSTRVRESSLGAVLRVSKKSLLGVKEQRN